MRVYYIWHSWSVRAAVFLDHFIDVFIVLGAMLGIYSIYRRVLAYSWKGLVTEGFT